MKRVLLGTLFVLMASAAFAQPFNAWLVNSAPGDTYITLANDAALNFAGGSFTFEAWVAITHSGDSECDSIAGNTFTAGQWIGLCGTSLRSYMSGSGSAYTIGTVTSKWTHIAVTFDNATKVHSHYVDGELAGSRVESNAMTASGQPWRIFHDAAWQYSPNGAIDEVRFWSVARTQEQIRDGITRTLRGGPAGNVAVYPLDGNANDVLAGHHGVKTGPGGFLNAPIGPTGCTTSSSQLCVGPGGRYGIRAYWQTESSRGNGTVASFTTADSGIFWFFAASNWEVVVKVLNGCGVNNRWWVFTSGLTNQHYELEVTDYQSAITKRYFNYQGVIAPQTQDVDAFATCP